MLAASHVPAALLPSEWGTFNVLEKRLLSLCICPAKALLQCLRVCTWQLCRPLPLPFATAPDVRINHYAIVLPGL